MIKTSNPVASAKMFNKACATSTTAGTMTIDGTANKLSFLLFLVVMGAALVWQKALSGDHAFTSSMMVLGGIGGLICAVVTVFNIKIAHITAPIYAIFEGLLLGGISAYAERQYPGIATQAITLTFGTLFALLFAYKTGVIKVTEKFKAGIFAATAGIAIFYFLSFILGIFNVSFGVGLIHGNSMAGIGFSVFVVAIAALNLVLDFDFVVQASRTGAPKKMEWYGAFALLVTLVWLYIEILRLLMKLRSRD